MSSLLPAVADLVLVRHMRARLVSGILLGAYGYVLAQTEPLQATIDAYMAHVNKIVGDALMPELAEHRELVKGTTEFSFRIDPAGHPNEIKAVSTPRNEFVEQTILRVLRASTFPPIPKRILKQGGYEYLEFRTKMGGPPDE